VQSAKDRAIAENGICRKGPAGGERSRKALPHSGPGATAEGGTSSGGTAMLKRLGRMQTTLRKRTALSGVGVHSGDVVNLTLHPAEADCGISFLRTDVEPERDREIPARREHVRATDHCTTIGVHGVSVSTVEHLMAALSALEIDNALIEIDG